MRTLDRLRLAQRLGDDEVAVRREAAFRLIEAMADLAMATHDGALATAAKASGLRVFGI